jgi:hypothetical protein
MGDSPIASLAPAAMGVSDNDLHPKIQVLYKCSPVKTAQR